MTISTHTIDSPLGPITLTATPDCLVGLDIGGGQPDSTEPSHPILSQVARELGEYFEGSRTVFTTPVQLTGTPFQRSVWAALQKIPYGHTTSYAALGADAGYPGAARAVGGAVGKNPVPIIVPCHRVLGANGAVTGYSGGDGIPTKQLLLAQENIVATA